MKSPLHSRVAELFKKHNRSFQLYHQTPSRQGQDSGWASKGVVEMRMAERVTYSAQKGELLSEKELKKPFILQHQTAGGTPQELAEAVQRALATSSVATISSPKPQPTSSTASIQ